MFVKLNTGSFPGQDIFEGMLRGGWDEPNRIVILLLSQSGKIWLATGLEMCSMNKAGIDIDADVSSQVQDVK